MQGLEYCNSIAQVSENFEKKYNKFKYVVVSTKKTRSHSFSYAFNDNATILFVGLWDPSNIIIYGFNNRLKIIQKLHNHKDGVSCLIFLKKSHQLASGSMDESIIIWNSNDLWKPDQKLLSHTSWINCMIVNKDEDLLISGSSDQYINFWQKINTSWMCQQRLDAGFNVSSLSFNALQTKLISCGFNSGIKVIEFQPDLEWAITQMIKVDEWGGFRLCFTSDNQFIFQEKGFLEIYKYDQEKKQFAKTQQVQIQNCENCENYEYFSIQFIESENILIANYGMNINLFGIDNQGDLVLQQQMEFEEDCQNGRLVDDGQYFVTWDGISMDLKVRRLLRLE